MDLEEQIKDYLDAHDYEYTDAEVSNIADTIEADYDLESEDLDDILDELIFEEGSVIPFNGIKSEGEDTDGDGDLDKVTLEKTDPLDNEGLAGETTPEEDLMLKLAGAADAPHDEGLAGETTPEEDLMLKLANPPKSAGLSGETTPEEDNMTNAIARMLADRRW